MIKVLVCGGRDYGWRTENNKVVADEEQQQKLVEVLDDQLSKANAVGSTFVLIHGNARGADTIAEAWAKMRGIKDIEVFPADWSTYGKAAGHIRNAQMLREGKPNLIIAFPGGRGTANMIHLGRKAGVPVYEVEV